MNIVVGGYIIAYPLGGMTWHHLNYLLGLRDLGHNITFLEDGGEWTLPYNPQSQTCEIDSTFGRAYLQRTFADYELDIAWCYYAHHENRYYGLSESELHQTLGDADLMLCISGVTPMRDSRPRAKRSMVIDTDPVFTQLRMRDDANFLNYYRQFDHVATFGRLIGTENCPLPTHGINWIPTNQPISMRHWPLAASPHERIFTTIGKWEHTTDRHMEFDGKQFLSSKGVEWMKLIDLPKLTNWEMTLAMQSMPGSVREQFERGGWKLTDSEVASQTCRSFQQFIQSSAGEFTVAKQIYSGIPSGWFSDRSAAYLASGRPVVTQSTGFEHWLSTGKGLFSFDSLVEAADALNTIAENYDQHSTAARRIAEEFFDSKIVLRDLLGYV